MNLAPADTNKRLSIPPGLWVTLLCSLVLLLLPQPVSALDNEAAEKVVLVLIDTLVMEDLQEERWPHLFTLARSGGIGLLNVRPGGGTHPAAGWLSLGMGARAQVGEMTGTAFNTDGIYQEQPVATMYTSLMGRVPPAEGVVVLGLPELVQIAGDARTTGRPGALGQTLQSAGRGVGILGNSDTHASFRRHGALIAMNKAGAVPRGDVSRALLTFDNGWPFGWRTDYERLQAAAGELLPQVDLLLIELGDLARLDSYTGFLDPGMAAQWEAAAAERADTFLAWLGQTLARAAAPATLLIVSPTPPAQHAQAGRHLTPLVMTRFTPPPPPQAGPPSATNIFAAAVNRNPANPPQPEPALLTSPTTRRPGLVSNTDMAPTVLSLLGLDIPAHMSGRPMHTTSVEGLAAEAPLPWIVPRDDAWAALSALHQRTITVNRLRLPIIQGYVIVLITVFLTWVVAVAVAYWRQERFSSAGIRWWQGTLLGLMSVPLAMLLLPPAQPAGVGSTVGLLLVLTVLITGAAMALTRKGRAMDAFILVAAATVAGIVLDILRGSPLIKASLLGYDPILGSRFYGIGNEYMGILIGSALVAATALLDRVPQYRKQLGVGVAVGFAGLVFLLAWPRMGANVGGGITALVGLGLTSLMLAQRRPTWFSAAMGSVLLLVFLGGAAAYDLSVHRDSPSHLGRTVQMAVHQGWAPVVEVAERKIAMNLRLVRWTVWSRVLLVSLGLTALLAFKPVPAIKDVFGKHPHLSAGIRGAVFSSLVALLVNDSGVVAAATIMAPTTCTLLYLVTQARHSQSWDKNQES